mmetsp:Transcript_48178/g.124322  ORF Transcript_48178/g.124322 Transcript_48178/m.124322 type:complete len:214 (-) Transcript_48178:170-811(-)
MAVAATQKGPSSPDSLIVRTRSLKSASQECTTITLARRGSAWFFSRAKPMPVPAVAGLIILSTTALTDMPPPGLVLSTSAPALRRCSAVMEFRMLLSWSSSMPHISGPKPRWRTSQAPTVGADGLRCVLLGVVQPPGPASTPATASGAVQCGALAECITCGTCGTWLAASGAVAPGSRGSTRVGSAHGCTSRQYCSTLPLLSTVRPLTTAGMP